jgi:translation initiation factor 2B subunit (eIF-2B alpha/beta/delta family)
MSSTIVKSKPASVDLERQIRRGKAVLRELKSTLEDLEDRREIAAAKKRNAGKSGTPLREAAKELGL